jgi:16S rRNA (uracil1498-N3)-methyltransferase
MTRRRWIADEVRENSAALVGEHAAHLARVLRARVGQEFDISTSESVRRARIASITANRVEFELGEAVAESVLPEITILLAVFKFDRMEWAIEKCTELGVSRIVPVIARRTDQHLASAAIKRAERWQRIARQSAEQSRRTNPPEISAPAKLTEVLNTTKGLRIVLAESEKQTLLRDVLQSDSSSGEIALAVGPEGGWTEEEEQSFKKTDWISVSLGSTILRAETAAIAATAIVVSAVSSL